VGLQEAWLRKVDFCQSRQGQRDEEKEARRKEGR